MKIKSFFCHLCVLSGLISITLIAQDSNSDKGFFVNSDYCRFWKNDSTGYLEISTAIYPNLATLRHDTSGLLGKIEMTILIQDKSNRAIVYNDRFNIPIYFADSTSLRKTKTLLNNRTYSLECGTYMITVHSRDSHNRLHYDSTSFIIDFLRRPSTAVLSDIELCSNISESTDKENVFYKNSYLVIPNPGCVFGSTSSPSVFTYMEIYNADPGKVYLVKSQILDQKGEVKKYRIYRRKFIDANVVDVTTLNVSSLVSGKYNYEIILSDTLNLEIEKSRRTIYIHNPQIQPVQTADAKGRSSEFAGMSFEELGEEFESARYITQAEDREMFEKLTSKESRQKFLENFWIKKQEEEGGHLNISREIYLRRVMIADQRYMAYDKKGSRSDRGRVYILYGEPDETQRYSSSSNRKPYEIWSYHAIEGGAEFIFIDLTGFGEYTLVHSSVHNEIHDLTWEHLLL